MLLVLAIVGFPPSLHLILIVRRRPPRVPLAKLQPDEHDVHAALQRIAADPEPNGRVGTLVQSAKKHDDGDDDEGGVPHHVEGYDGLGVTPVGAALLQVAGGGFTDQHGGAAAAGCAAEEGG